MAEAADGIILGRHYDDETKRIGERVIYQGERHLLLFGPNGSGKNTRFLTPNLLSIKDRSIIVIDPKGELAAITAAYRHKAGNDVKILDPFGKLHEAVKDSADHRYLIEKALRQAPVSIRSRRSIRSQQIFMTTRRRSATR
jgi:energy-coupling factor transporter ATP-binding protein EcfA2